MGQQLRVQRPPIHNISDLCGRCLNIWYNLYPAIYQGHVTSMPRRDEAVLRAKKKLNRNVSIVQNCWEQWSRNGTASRRPGSRQPRGTTERENHRIRCTASATKIRTAVDTTVTQRTVKNRILQGQLRARSLVVCILLTPRRCRLRRWWCQDGAHWWRTVMFSDESRFCFGVNNGRVFVRGRPVERLPPYCLRPRYI
ncbi:uncharacterized protein TNCV_5117231 [Trichonephila clavipes]|nr:uncharacterized protein TNCV_5117231 [Trichonephila clavipes]